MTLQIILGNHGKIYVTMKHIVYPVLFLTPSYNAVFEFFSSPRL